MIRRIEDFVNDYTWERDVTLKVLRNLTDESLSVCKTEGDTPICELAWHIVEVIPYMMNQAGLPIDTMPKPEAFTAQRIAEAYETVSDDVLHKVQRWNDADLGTTDTVFGMEWPKGVTLNALVHHEIHHRGQLSVLMRQAGLTVPNIYGPNKEETAIWMAQQAAETKV